jgi:hypothetical protein
VPAHRWQFEPRLMLDGGIPAGMDLGQANWFYQNTFAAPTAVAPQWDGDVAAGDAGSLGPDYLAAIAARINAYRWMAGLPGGVTLDPTEDAQAQQAALMMSANGQLNHSPPPSWVDYTADGAAAAGHSDLYLGGAGVQAIDGYMTDPGDNNTAVGHRRWLLDPSTRTMGVGDIPAPPASYLLAGGFPPANALYVVQPATTPAPSVTAVAWPPAGYVPAPLMPQRWSLQLAAAGDFSSATVSVTRDGVAQPVEILSVNGNYAGPAIVWDLPSTPAAAPGGTVVYTVDVANVMINGQPQSFSYTTTSFDPANTTALEPVPAQVEFLRTIASASTNGNSAVVEVARSMDADSSVSVAYTTADGSARAGVNFRATSGVLTFAPGQFYAQIVVPILPGDARDPGGIFSIQLSSPSGASLGPIGAIRVSTSPSLLPSSTTLLGERRVRLVRGKKAVTGYQLLFSGPLDLLNAQVTGHYRVVQIRKGHPRRVAIRSLALSPAQESVTLTLGAFEKHELLLLNISGLVDSNGLKLGVVSTAL